VAVHVPPDILIGRHDQDAALYAYDIAIESVKTGEHGAGDHLIDGPERRLAAPEIEHAVEPPQERRTLKRRIRLRRFQSIWLQHRVVVSIPTFRLRRRFSRCRGLRERVT
jgi:hypothetical protein